jgi:hypothetical protein
VPEATIYMEDVDSDYDGFPDVWEMQQYGKLATRGPVSGSTFFATVNPDLKTSLAAYNLGSSISSSTENLGFSLMSVLLDGTDGTVAMMADLLSDPSAPAAETVAVRISSFSFEGGIELEVKSATASDVSNLITFTNEAQVDLYVACASAPDFADAVEVKVKSFTIHANDTTLLSVTPEELAAVKANAPEAKFFKAIIR